MAAFDPNQFSPFYKVFSELSVAQCETVLFLALGATVEDISEFRGVTPGQIRKSLQESQRRLSVFSQSSLKLIVVARLFLYTANGICLPERPERRL